MKLLTIVIPSYNAGGFLRDCVGSVVSAPGIRDRLEELEILIVDDGSTDDTAEAAEGLCREYPGTCLLFRKENGGHGSCINLGILRATGRYFKVLDADDQLEPSELTGFLDVLGSVDADVVASDFLCIEEGTGKLLGKKRAAPRNGLYGRTVDLEKVRIDKVIKMHSFTVRTAVLQEHFRPIDEHMFYVDQEFITYPVPYIHRVYYDRRFLYRYRLGRKGQSMSPEILKENRRMHRAVIDRLIGFYREIVREGTISGHQLGYLERCIGDMIDAQFQIYITLGDRPGIREELKAWDQELLDRAPELWAATSKKSIALLRQMDYRILPFAKAVHLMVKGKR